MGLEEGEDEVGGGEMTIDACTCIYVHTCTYVCWNLLSNHNFKGPYLEAEVVEEVMGWLG